MTYDVLIRGGTLIDGTGAPARTGDVALKDGQIVALGDCSGVARRTLDAEGCVVTPGFVDIHTHYDGQVTWDPLLSPSCYHGVTTAVMGNCGVGFAPVRPDQHDFLIQLMEGVEDIPGAALHEGIQWAWETFPQYLDALELRHYSMDIGTQVPHGAVRTYVMGERGANNEEATAEDIASMAEIVRDALAAGALGFSTSRTIAHRAITGEPVPGTFATEDELFGIGRVLGDLGRGIFEVAGAGAAGEDIIAPKTELDWMRRLSAEIKRPVTFGMLQVDAAPDLWRELLDLSTRAAREGAQIYPQVAGRPFGLLVGLQTTFHPFDGYASYLAVAHMPLEERVVRLRDRETRRAILDEAKAEPSPLLTALGRTFPLGEPLNYEPSYDDSVEAIANRQDRNAIELVYDLMTAGDGETMLLVPVLNYSNLNADPLLEMMQHPNAVLGLGDGGAHCATICDASIQTFMLTHWVRDRTRGPRMPVELVVQRMTRDSAELYGLRDRGVLAAGMKADVNVIDLDDLCLEAPRMCYDLPAGGKRIVQRARGYRATIVSGELTMENDEPTGAYPGVLIRGGRDC